MVKGCQGYIVIWLYILYYVTIFFGYVVIILETVDILATMVDPVINLRKTIGQPWENGGLMGFKRI